MSERDRMIHTPPSERQIISNNDRDYGKVLLIRLPEAQGGGIGYRPVAKIINQVTHTRFNHHHLA